MGSLRLAALVVAWLAAGGVVAEPIKAQYVVVEKEARRLTLYRGGEALRTYPIDLGGNPIGHKLYEGDQRTPEGTYSIDFKNPDSAYHLSLRISYPNEADKARAQQRGLDPGGMIMIHGVGDRLRRMPDWTDGCIAVSNRAIEEIWRMVDEATPVVIRP